MSITDAIKNSVLESFNTTLSTADILLGLAMSLAAGLFILLIYRQAMRQVSFNRNFCITLLLVCAISAMVVLTITSNLALSLGMVGALSIVRFRTAIKDASDTAFMFWSVAAGITAGAGFYQLTIIGCLFIGALCMLSVVVCNYTDRPFLLVVKAQDGNPAAQIEQALNQGQIRYRLCSMAETGTGTELIYEVGFRDKAHDLILSLKSLPGVSGISLVDCRKN